jgi:hypothetical protein
MSNSYTDVTGVLVFNGKPNVTRVIAALFGSFGATGEEVKFEKPNEIIISQSDEADYTTWSGIDSGFAETLTKGFSHLGIDLSGVDSYPDLLTRVGRHFGVEAKVSEIIRNIDFEDGAVDLGELFRLASLLDDGHNLVSMRLMGGYTSDTIGLWDFGGYTQFHNGHVDFCLGTSSLLAMADLIEAGNVDKAYTGLIQQILSSITDENLRAKVSVAAIQGIREIAAVPAPKVLSRDVLTQLIQMADSHVEDIESGLEDGTYEAADNTDLPEKQKALESAKAFCEALPSDLVT